MQESLLCIMDRTVPAATAFCFVKSKSKQGFKTTQHALNRHVQKKRLWHANIHALQITYKKRMHPWYEKDKVMFSDSRVSHFRKRVACCSTTVYDLNKNYGNQNFSHINHCCYKGKIKVLLLTTNLDTRLDVWNYSHTKRKNNLYIHMLCLTHPSKWSWIQHHITWQNKSDINVFYLQSRPLVFHMEG
jgi:hypothetical protein